MGLTKLRRRRVRANYSHTEPAVEMATNEKGKPIALHVANRDVRGDGRHFDVRRLPRAIEVERAKAPKRERRDDRHDEG
jgi:hypothetical protein